MSKKAVVIGAGQSGRGYTARYLYEKGYEITFIDEKKELVELLKKGKSYEEISELTDIPIKQLKQAAKAFDQKSQ